MLGEHLHIYVDRVMTEIITKISDENILRPIITEILNNNQNLVSDYHNGKRVFDFFVGQVMKETKGQADPSKTAEIIRKELEVRK